MSASGVSGPASSSAAVNANNPWPGLVAFRETDAHYFQGRQTETEELLRLILRERLTTFFGLSGLGKSSLLQAGVFPRLRRENIFPVYIRLDFSEGSPDFTSQITALIAREADVHGIEAPTAGSDVTLWAYLHREGNHFWNARNRPVQPLLVFDQFEEIFTLGRLDAARRERTEAFIGQLADLAEGRPPSELKTSIDENPEQAGNFSFGRHYYKILLSIREDFLPELEGLRTRMPGLALNRLRLQRMSGEAALQVVNQASHLINPDVAVRVVRFVAADKHDRPLADVEVEPALLSVVCRELNNKRLNQGEPKITEYLLEGSQEQVLSDFYDRSTADLPPAVRYFIEERLLTVSGYRDSIALENALNMPGVTRGSVDLLVERRMIRREDRGGAQRLELTHDLLAGVVRASRDSRLQREEAERERAALAQAQEQARQEANRERERQERERNRRDLRRSRIAAVIFLLLTVAACGAAAWAIRAQKEADHLRAKAAREADHANSSARLALSNAELAQQNAALAMESKKAAERAAIDANDQREIAKGVLLQSTLSKAADLVANDKIPESLAYVAQGLRIDDRSVAVRSFAADLLLRQNWWLPVQQWSNPAAGHIIGVSADGQRVLVQKETWAQVWNSKTNKAFENGFTVSPYGGTAALSRDGRYVGVGSVDGAGVWEVENGLRLAFIESPQRVGSVIFSPDGLRLLTESEDASVQAWDAKTGKAVGSPLRHQARTSSIEFSPDGRRVAIASGQTAEVWDPETGRALVLHHTAPVTSARFSPDGTRLVSSAEDHVARVWEVENGTAVTTLPHKSQVDSATFSPDGRRVVTTSDRAAQEWDTETGKNVGFLEHKSKVRFAALHADGRRVLTVERAGARLWDDTQPGQFFRGPHFFHPGLDTAFFSPDGRRIITGSRDAVRLWEAAGRIPVRTLRHDQAVNHAAFSRDGRRLVTVAYSAAQVWDAHTGQPIGKPLQHDLDIRSANWSPDGRWIVTASRDKTARVWDAATGKPAALMQHKEEVDLALFSSDGRTLFTAANIAHAWDAKTGVHLRTLLPGHEGVVAFSPDRRRVMTQGGNNDVQLWEAATGRRLGAPLTHPFTFGFAAFSLDSRRVITVAHTMAQVWDAETGKRVGVRLEYPQRIRRVALSPDGRRVLISSTDTQVLDADTGHRVGAAMDGTDFATFSEDGRCVLTGSGTAARVWDAETGKPIGTDLPHNDEILFAAFSPDGRRVVTASRDRTARVWDLQLDSGSPQDTALLADAAEAIGGYRINEMAALVPLSIGEQLERINNLRARASRARDQRGTLMWFLRRFFLLDNNRPGSQSLREPK